MSELINETLKKSAGFSPWARKKLPTELDKLRSELFAVFYHHTQKGARDAFEKILEKRWSYKKSVQKLIENIDKNFETFTHYLPKDSQSPSP